MEFTIDNNMPKVKGKLFYINSDHAFTFQPRHMVDIYLEFGYLLLDFDSESCLAKQIGGYHPRLGWLPMKLIVPFAVGGGLLLNNAKAFVQPPGVATGVIDDGEWKTYYDSDTGWVCFGSYETEETDEAVEFLDGVIAVVSEKKIKALWMHPIIRDTYE